MKFDYITDEYQKQLGKETLITLYEVLGAPTVCAIQWRGNNIMEIATMFSDTMLNYTIIDDGSVILNFDEKKFLLELYDYIVLDINGKPAKYLCGRDGEEVYHYMKKKIKATEIKKVEKQQWITNRSAREKAKSSKLRNYVSTLEIAAIQWTGDNKEDVKEFLKKVPGNDLYYIVCEPETESIVLKHLIEQYEGFRIAKGSYISWSVPTGFKIYSETDFNHMFKPV